MVTMGDEMPLVFVHGVNTRNTDEDYSRAVAARKTMFEQIVVPTVVKKGFPNFSVAEDIYWGDLGVTFSWALRSIPETKIIDSLGPEEGAAQNLDLFGLVLEAETAAPEVEALGVEQPLVAAAEREPAALVRAVFAQEADRFAPLLPKPPAPELSEQEAQKAEIEGEHLGLILIAVDRFARLAAQAPDLLSGTTDDEVLEKIRRGVFAEYQKLAEAKLHQSEGEVEHLGRFGDAIQWAKDHLVAVVDHAKEAVRFTVEETKRGATLIALKLQRDNLSRRTLRFLGDVFVYLQRGRSATPGICERVKTGLLALDGKSNDKGEREPFILITHSFGSEIVYELLTAGELSGLTIDLWVTAGAQTSLFAEMLLFTGMPPIPASTSNFTLGRPAGVKKWINFYDAADVLSYLHEPVFGSSAVKDVAVRDRANVTNAHGHYFMDPEFYERVAAEL
jgi:hypothetical protein